MDDSGKEARDIFYKRLKEANSAPCIPNDYPIKIGPEFEEHRQRIWQNNFKTKDFEKLEYHEWLNDTIIDRYFEMIVQRSKQSRRLPKVYAFNCFFYGQYKRNKKSALQDWIQEDIFKYDLLLLPICHSGNHWTMIVADVQNKIIIGYDSMGIDRTTHLETFRNILVERAKIEAQNSSDIDPKIPWECCMDDDAPRQKNSHDCGVFVCQYAQYVSNLNIPEFNQVQMNYFRKRMRYELLMNRILE